MSSKTYNPHTLPSQATAANTHSAADCVTPEVCGYFHEKKRTVNQFKKGYQHKSNTIRNKKGELAMNTKEKAEIWKEYFDK